MAEMSIPLARLFVMGAGQLVSRMHDRLEEEGWRPIRPSYGFVLSRVRAQPATIVELAAFLGITKQASSKLVEQMERDGLVDIGPHPTDSRAKSVAISEQGRRLLMSVERIYADLEAEWADVLGHEMIEEMREGLKTVLRATNGGALPPMRPM